eukprot:TRINITY_DN2081_c0_g1_i1.p2 TRINITY_DN2081_c0_g1~~TRINITY_DN2081_c0_g1_i1.p2  ORF type:complete len:398 (-),score=101.90 TRINITY_DN2081_c0_g1_i1:18-1211(-)
MWSVFLNICRAKRMGLLHLRRSDRKSLSDILQEAQMDARTRYQLISHFMLTGENKADFSPERYYDKQELLGKGAFGEVYKAYDKMGETVAVKIMTAQDQQGLDEGELDLMKILDHKHVVRLINYFYDQGHLTMVMKCYNTNLKSYLLNITDRYSKEMTLPPSLLIDYACQIAKGLKYLHFKQIAHRDLKCDNVLISYDEIDKSLILTLTDFGLSKTMSESDTLHLQTVAGTQFFMAPEIGHGGYNPFLADVYSLGCTLYEMCTGTPRKPLPRCYPYKYGALPVVGEDKSESDKMDMITFTAAVESCLAVNPEERGSASDVLSCLKRKSVLTDKKELPSLSYAVLDQVITEAFQDRSLRDQMVTRMFSWLGDLPSQDLKDLVEKFNQVWKTIGDNLGE